MKVVVHALRLLWWFGAGSLPFLISRYYQSYRQAIQCPTSGDCYTPGSEHLLGLELLAAFSALTIWPLLVWYAVVQPWRTCIAQRRRKPATHSGNPRP